MQDTDAIDRTILSILSREARIPMKSLAGRIGLSRSDGGTECEEILTPQE